MLQWSMDLYILLIKHCCIIVIMLGHQFGVDSLPQLNDGNYINEFCFTLQHGYEDVKEFYRDNPKFKKLKEIRLGDVTFHCAKFDLTKRTRAVSARHEDKDINNLRRNKKVSWIEQQRGHTIVRRTIDTKWSDLWHLNDDVTPSMKVTEAWSAGYTGSGVIIAILDDGIQTNHTDLDSNVDTTNDIDVYDNDNDPSPPPGDTHGTHIAGFIAAVRDNNDCTVGVAYNSTILGVRILGEYAITDSQEAEALSHYSSNVDIYSSSWGPDDGYDFVEPGIMTKTALQAGVSTGRNGKGVIFTWAAGNGDTSDNCNGDGYVNSIYTIGITSVQIGQNAWYSEVCAAALAATYGGSSNDRYLTTTTESSGCTSDGIQGTSYSTPIASGIIALALQANQILTWRDVQHLIVLTSGKNDITDTYSDWATNGAGKEYSQVLGFGLMNAEALVTRATEWVTVPTQHTCTTSTAYVLISTSGAEFSRTVKTVSQSDCPSVVYLEHVKVTVTFSYTRYRGVTEIYLVSPAGTESHLLHYRHTDAIQFTSAGSLTWTFISVHFWRETLVGSWTLKVRSHQGLSRITLQSWFLTFYGTTTDSLSNIDPCASSPCQSGETCTNLGYTYSCQIVNSCTNCYTQKPDKGDRSNTAISKIIVIVICVVVGIAGIILITVIIKCAINRAKVGVYTENGT